MRNPRPLLNRRVCLNSLAAAAAMPFLRVGAQDAAPATPPSPPDLTKPQTTRWRIGMNLETPVTFTAGLATFPIFVDWPEQTVTITDRTVEGRVGNVATRNLDGATQIVVAIPRLTSGGSVKVEVEMEVVRQPIIAPTDTSNLVIPKRLARELQAYMGNSPMIDASDVLIRNLSRELAADAPENAWDYVRKIYDTVRERVRYYESEISNASEALKNGVGDCEEMTSLFVALCRNAKVPARMVWIPGHCYPEFYLEPAGAKSTRGSLAGTWYPCQAAGTEQFGGMMEARPTLQKGDRFRIPEQRAPVRYVAEFFRCDRQGTKDPRVKFIREQIPA